jgi:plasmid maintenance system killer protein
VRQFAAQPRPLPYRIIVSSVAASAAEELHSLPLWKAHVLTGDRKGQWSLSVTANLRLTFRVQAKPPVLFDLNLEDYH